MVEYLLYMEYFFMCYKDFLLLDELLATLDEEIYLA